MPRPDVTDVTAAMLRGWPLPEPGDNKDAGDQTLVVGGSRKTPGAVLLAAEAALRAGAGKLQVVTVESVALGVAVVLPEAMVKGVPETSGGDIEAAG